MRLYRVKGQSQSTADFLVALPHRYQAKYVYLARS